MRFWPVHSSTRGGATTSDVVANGRWARTSSTGRPRVSPKSGPAAVLCCCTADKADSRPRVSFHTRRWWLEEIDQSAARTTTPKDMTGHGR